MVKKKVITVVFVSTYKGKEEASHSPHLMVDESSRDHRATFLPESWMPSGSSWGFTVHEICLHVVSTDLCQDPESVTPKGSKRQGWEHGK